jgi:hypothetical protein
MKNNNELVVYRPNIFIRIKNFFRNIFMKNRNENIELPIHNVDAKRQNNFREEIVIKEDKEKIRIEKLMRQYDAGEIVEEDISDEDMEKLIELYNQETEELNLETELLDADTNRRKANIEKIIKSLNKK